MILEDATGKRDAWKKSRGSRLATRSRRSGSINGVSNCIILRAADPSTGAVALISHSLSRSQNVGSPSRCLKNRNRPCTLLSMMAGVVRRVSTVHYYRSRLRYIVYIRTCARVLRVRFDRWSIYVRERSRGLSPRASSVFLFFFSFSLSLFARENKGRKTRRLFASQNTRKTHR